MRLPATTLEQIDWDTWLYSAVWKPTSDVFRGQESDDERIFVKTGSGQTQENCVQKGLVSLRAS
jgi:hypothetical protein